MCLSILFIGTVTGGFSSQRTSNAESMSISWHHHEVRLALMLVDSPHIEPISWEVVPCHIIIMMRWTWHCNHGFSSQRVNNLENASKPWHTLSWDQRWLFCFPWSDQTCVPVPYCHLWLIDCMQWHLNMEFQWLELISQLNLNVS